MNIDEAIRHAKEISENQYICKECKDEHKQLAEWLEELSAMREKEKRYRWHDLRKNPDDTRMGKRLQQEQCMKMALSHNQNRHLIGKTIWIVNAVNAPITMKKTNI